METRCAQNGNEHSLPIYQKLLDKLGVEMNSSVLLSNSTSTTSSWTDIYGSSTSYNSKSNYNLMLKDYIKSGAVTTANRNLVLNGAVDGDIEIKPGQSYRLLMPDGAVINVDADGNYVIEDKDAKVTYKAKRIREFNRYVNASDCIQEFMRFLKEFDIRQGEVLHIPIELFIRFLIMRAAETDDVDAPPEAKGLTREIRSLSCERTTYRCLACGRFVKHRKAKSGFMFCNGQCATEYDKQLDMAG